MQTSVLKKVYLNSTTNLSKATDSEFVEWVFDKLGIPFREPIKPLSKLKRELIITELLEAGIGLNLSKPSEA